MNFQQLARHIVSAMSSELVNRRKAMREDTAQIQTFSACLFSDCDSRPPWWRR